MNDNAGQDNLHALINNTRDLIWSVDTNYALISSNTAFDEMMVKMTGAAIAAGGNVLTSAFTGEQLVSYKGLYDRAMAGEAFSVIEHTQIEGDYWSELSFYPIRKDGGVTGTACFAHNITDFKKAQSDLTLARDRLLFHLENTTLGFIEWDNKLHLKTWSKKAEEIFGWTEQEFSRLQKKGDSQVYKDDLPWVSKIARQLVAGEIERNSIRHRNYTKDGRVIWCEWFNSVLKDVDGKVITIMSQVRDITGQVEAAARMTISNHLYAFISQVNQSITHAENEAAVIKGACQAAIEFGKFTDAWIDIVDETGTATHDSNDAITHVDQTGECYICNDIGNDPLLDNWKHLSAECGWRSCIILPVKKAGASGTFTIVSSAVNFFQPEWIVLLKEAAGDVSFALNIFEKDRHKVLMEEKAVQGALKLKQAQSIAHVGSWDLDFSTGVVEWSDELCRIYGIAPCETRQTFESWLSFIHPLDREYVNRITKEGHETLKNSSFYHRIIRKDGEVRYILSQSQVKFNKENKPVGLAGVAHDITEQKMAEMERSKMIADIVQRNKNLEQFSYIVSHNMRAPVANISGIVEILQMPGTDLPEQEKWISELGVSVKKLDKVIMDLNNILKVTHTDNNKKELVRFSELLNDIIFGFNGPVKSNHIKIVSDFSVIDEMLTLKSYLYSIFFNLISNSIKYRQPGIAPVIEIRSARTGNRVMIIFKDNGLGIDLEKRGAQVFGLYKRFHWHVEGKGMGLYMVKAQVESLGGRISVVSAVNKGTEFIVEFEIADKPDNQFHATNNNS